MLSNNSNKKGRIQIEPQSSANRPSNIWAQILVLVKFIVLEGLSLAGIKTTLSAHTIEWVHDWLLQLTCWQLMTDN